MAQANGKRAEKRMFADCVWKLEIGEEREKMRGEQKDMNHRKKRGVLKPNRLACVLLTPTPTSHDFASPAKKSGDPLAPGYWPDSFLPFLGCSDSFDRRGSTHQAIIAQYDNIDRDKYVILGKLAAK